MECGNMRTPAYRRSRWSRNTNWTPLNERVISKTISPNISAESNTETFASDSGTN